MEKADRELLENLLTSNYQLRKLYEEHIILEDELKVFKGNQALTINDIMREKELKKMKLRGMDEIMTILSQYRQAA